MDNSQIFRNRVLFDPEVCVKCGYCKSNCPTYLAKKDERVSPRGRLVISKKLYSGLSGMKDFLDFYRDLDTCSKCVECERICPVGLKPWVNFILVKNQTLLGNVESIFAKSISKNRFFFRTLFWIFMKIRGSKYRSENVRNIKLKKTEYVYNRDSLFIFPTCFGYTFFKNTIKKAVLILKYFGLDAKTFPDDFTCCGAPIFLSGDMEGFKKHAQMFYQRLIQKNKNQNKDSRILVFGATCAWILKDVFPGEVGVSLGNIQEISDYLMDVISCLRSDFIKLNKKFLIHKPCHRERGLGEFFRSIGMEFEETDFPCCGFGGSLMFKHWDMSDLLLEKTLEGKESDLVISTSPGCIIQLSRRKRVFHLVDFIFNFLLPKTVF